ncbi:alpha/beta hydrolase [Carboxylicivirga sp. RSCT41]|uniref:alpha/beta hydrolase n=1 Tax=Carboxylicivirga agarovorans TaxID=3417570 RepID=UPI003D34C357
MKTLPLLLFMILLTSVVSGQEINIGFKDSIESKVLNENRKFIVKLPRDYNASERSYPVLYRLDGDMDVYTETVGTINRLVHMDELIPDMIIVMIGNTNRNRDMMPVNTSYFTSDPGADNFIAFIESELIPHINNSYRTTSEKLLCGQSISAIFTFYYFLTHTDSFNSYIACSGGFPDCEDYFIDLTDQFLETEQVKPTCLYMTQGLKDFLDPDGVIKKQLYDFTQRIESKENIVCKMKSYEDEGHVPFQSLYDALRFIYSEN